MELPGDRLSRLSEEASLRINESIDLDAVPQGVLDSARSLTDARYAFVTTFDESGGIQEFLVSGLTARACELVSRRSHTISGRERGQHPRRQERARPGVQPGGRGDAGHVRLPGGAGDRQRPEAPGRTEGEGRFGCPGGSRPSVYPPGPLTVNSSRLDSFLPPWVQMAPWAPQSVVTGRTTVTPASEPGPTWTSHPILLGGSRRRAPVTEPPCTVKAWSRRVL